MRCKQCKVRMEKTDKVFFDNINWRYCSKSCRLNFVRAKQKKLYDRAKLKKVKDRVKKQNSISYLTKEADKLWSEAVKIEYNYECQVEWCEKRNYLNSHHLFTRSRKNTRWDIDNWICLCAGHHTLSSHFSAHQTPLEFFEWLEWLKGRDWIDRQSLKSRIVCKVTPDLIKQHIVDLREYISKYKKT